MREWFNARTASPNLADVFDRDLVAFLREKIGAPNVLPWSMV